MANAGQFLKKMVDFDKDNVSPRVIKKLGGYFNVPGFDRDSIMKNSAAAASLFMWVKGIYVYSRARMQGRDMSSSPVRQQQPNNRQSLSQSFNSIAEEPRVAPTQYNDPSIFSGEAETPQRNSAKRTPSYLNSTASRNAKTQRAQSATVSAKKPRMMKS